MKEKSILSNLSWTLVGELVNKATLFFATMYFAKTLSAENYGVFSLMQAIAMYSVMAIEISPTMYAIREIAKCTNGDKIYSKAEEIYGLRVFAGVLVSAIYLLALYIFRIDETRLYTGFAFFLYIISYALFSDWLHKGLENFKGIAIASLCQAALFIPLVVFFINDEDDLFLAASIWSASFLVFAFVLYYLQKKVLGVRVIPIINIPKWRENIRESYHFGLNGVLGMTYQFIPLFLLSSFSSMKMVGSFSLMYKLTFAVCGLAYYLPSVFYPKLSRSAKVDFKVFIELQKKLMLAMIVASLFLLLFSFLGKKIFISYFNGDKYLDLEGLYNVFSVLVVAYLIRFSFNIPLLAMGKQNVITKQMGYASLLVLALGFPMVFYRSALGAAYTALLGEIFIVIFAASVYLKAISKEKKFDT
jgi:O-antigen/teichoic acid export membrane protein